jgi:3-oxoacid CoA-transferase subunit B
MIDLSKVQKRTTAQIAKRIVQDIPDGAHVNLGIGQPMTISNFLPSDKEILLHSENGLLGVGPYPYPDQVDPDLINAGKEVVTALPGASFFDSATSFSMIRGGKVDVAILGAMEVSSEGDLANWIIPGKLVKGMGGAMDLVHGARRVIVLTEHTSKNGTSKLLSKCSLPLTGKRVAHRVITDLCVMDTSSEGFILRELAAGVSFEEVIEKTDATVIDKRSK